MAAFDLRSSETRANERFARARESQANSADWARSQAQIPLYVVKGLPREVRDALYNLEPGTNSRLKVPGDQLAFYCFNYGSARALSYAAGLPMLCLRSAVRRPGHRPKSRSLLEAVLKYREAE